jgi:hypothetical protein
MEKFKNDEKSRMRQRNTIPALAQVLRDGGLRDSSCLDTNRTQCAFVFSSEANSSEPFLRRRFSGQDPENFLDIPLQSLLMLDKVEIP